MGLELDQRLPGYDFIWTFQQNTLPEFWVYDLQLGMYIPEVYAASGVDLAGGACIAGVTGYSDPVLVGLHQASPDYVNVYELPTLTMPGAIVDIKANGGDAGVLIFDTNNVKLTIDVIAAGDAGLNCDIFVLVRNAAGKKWCYNLANDRWYKGWCYEYVTGALTDYTDTVLDMPLPIGLYDAWIVIDTNPNGNLNGGSAVLVYDHVDFEVTVAGAAAWIKFNPICTDNCFMMVHTGTAATECWLDYTYDGYYGPGYGLFGGYYDLSFKLLDSGSTLFDNGDTDGINGISAVPEGLFGPGYRKVMDNFVLSGVTVDTFSFLGLYYYGTLTGTDAQLEFLADAGGTPGGTVFTAVSAGYSETLTGRTWFGLPEFEGVYNFAPIGL
jgi:hypothetical protein